MIRAHRLAATALDDTSLLSGWNIAPNVAYVLHLLPGPTSCGVLLYNEDETVLVASGAALAGADQPCVLVAWAGQSIQMVDPELGWHILLSTTGTESQRTVRILPTVDLPDEIHPVYGVDALASARAAAAINEATHYAEEILVSCPLGLGAAVGDVVSVPVDGAQVVGQVESVTWEGTPSGTSETAVIRRHVPIAPDVFVEPPAPELPTVVDDAGTTPADAVASGNVLTNDESGLTVVAVAGLAANVGQPVAGSAGGAFVIAANGAWSFDPGGDFITLVDDETVDTSVVYHAGDGEAEAWATLTITVSAPENPIAVDDRWDDVVFCINAAGEDGSTDITDAKGLPVTLVGAVQVDTETLGYPAVQFRWDVDSYMTLSNSPDTKIESGVFTFDCWFYNTSSGMRACLSNKPSWDNKGAIIGFDASGNVWYRQLGGTIISTSSPIIPLNTLMHLEVSVDASRFCRIFIDGVLRASGTVSAGVSSSNALLIGRERTVTTSSGQFSGFMPAIRLTRGATVRHTENFDPPSFPFPEFGG